MTVEGGNEDFRAGLVALVGRPNVGKSTLLNALIGFRLSIVTPRPQTTRHRILGIHTDGRGQIVYVDTPGMHRAEKLAMNRMMNRAARSALSEVQLAVLVIEAGQWREDDETAWKAVREAGVPAVLVINKVDRLTDKSQLLPFIAKVTAERDFLEVFPLSATRKKGLDALQDGLLRHLPPSAPLFAEDEITDRSERFLAGELLREQLMRQLGQELPYASTVEIERFEEDGNLRRIAAVIWVERPSQKAIVIGKQGARLKAISASARREMESLFDGKVFLETWCKVRDDWSDDESALRQFGYQD
ncbi:MAG: GTPase Era [Rhodanobacteraceae bacterium]|nr:GTPase Era [Xanthomonadales bacterium]MCP5478266.1 GTPase Era [Rhodanobacteraceae bacterium]HPF72955.1 GTPase Era [Xanthomonadaceae bacterium]HRX99948.1 GTPase Era [Xanthomonadaceae bacterium]